MKCFHTRHATFDDTGPPATRRHSDHATKKKAKRTKATSDDPATTTAVMLC